MKTFGYHFRESDQKVSKKALGLSVKKKADLQSRETLENLVKWEFYANGKCIVKTLIKPVVHEDFWVLFPQKWLKVSKKH